MTLRLLPSKSMRKELLNQNNPSVGPGQAGQSLIEILIGIAIGAILIGGAAATITLTLRSNTQNKNIQTASALAQSMLDKVTVFADADWHNIDGTINCGAAGISPDVSYYLASFGSGLECKEGAQSESVDTAGIVFSTSFSVEPVDRNQATDAISPSSGSTYEDPSTKKIIAVSAWLENGQAANVTVNKYITRSRNLIYRQSNWKAGGGLPGPFTVIDNQYDTKSKIDTSNAGLIKVLGF